MDAIDLLKQDHRRVEQLFARFLEAQSEEPQEDLFQEIQTELAAHAEAEERVFYPAMKEHAREQVEEAVSEHAGVKQMLADLLDLDIDDETFDERFNTLMENVQHHVEEEEAPEGLLELARQKLNPEMLSEMVNQIQAVKRDVENDLAA